MLVLQAHHNLSDEQVDGFTCQPGNSKFLGRPAPCSNEAARQWSAEWLRTKPSEPGIIYVLAGATQRGVSRN
jgi:hypothetical protein